MSDKTVRDDNYKAPEGCKVIYLCGGCFWGTERVFQILDGVIETEVGYANGHTLSPTYEEVCRHNTGYRECVRITYDPRKVSTETILTAYFMCVDPTRDDGQGGDIGEQYLLGVYYRDDELKGPVTDFLEKEKEKYPEFHVDNKPLEVFYEAEEYHQDYLIKNPTGYCHITKVEMDEVRKLNK